MAMGNWRHIVVFADYAIIWRGLAVRGRAYSLTAARRQRLEAVLGDTITPATDGQSWLWSWNDWNWSGIGGR
jgi:hypothetical protein